ncbi:hypothetical protein PISMIDRAFT_675797, partial [Pisolithus microcarpus 441]
LCELVERPLAESGKNSIEETMSGALAAKLPTTGAANRLFKLGEFDPNCLEIFHAVLHSVSHDVGTD